MPAGGWQAENGLRNVEAQHQVAGVWYAGAKSNGSSWGEIFFTGCKSESAVGVLDDEVFCLVER